MCAEGFRVPRSARNAANHSGRDVSTRTYHADNRILSCYDIYRGTPTETDLDAEEADHPNKWQIFIDPVTIDIDVFDIADIVGDLPATVGS